jgi:hypothetical protein
VIRRLSIVSDPAERHINLGYPTGAGRNWDMLGFAGVDPAQPATTVAV